MHLYPFTAAANARPIPVHDKIGKYYSNLPTFESFAW